MKKPLLITLLVLIVDTLTKQLIIHNLVENQSITIINNLLNITYAKNTGIAFSILEGRIPMIIIMTIIIVLIIINYLKKNLNTQETIFYSLILGGALGNLFDRIIYGYVIDFIDFHVSNNHFPTFNVADSCIVIGVLLLLLTKKEGEEDEYHRRKERKNRQISNK